MDKKQQEAVIEQVIQGKTKRELAIQAAQQIGRCQKEIAKRDRLIADLTAQKSKAQLEASGIIAEARQQEQAIRMEADAVQADAQRRVKEADNEAARKIANATAEADSIVETKLLQAKNEIENLEDQRDDIKRMTTSLNANIAESYDELVEKMTVMMSEMKDMQVRLRELSSTIEAEDFKKFDINDYVTTTKAEVPAKSADDDDEEDSYDLFSLSQLDAFVDPVVPAPDPEPEDEEDEEEPEPEPEPKPAKKTKKKRAAVPAPKPTPEPEQEPEPEDEEDDEDFDFDLNGSFDFSDDDDDDFSDLDAFAVSLTESDDEDDFDDIDSDDFYDNGKAKSFTDAFMAVSSSAAADDVDDFDFDDILDDDDDDDDFNVVEESESPLIVPQRPNRSQRKGGPARWL